MYHRHGGTRTGRPQSTQRASNGAPTADSIRSTYSRGVIALRAARWALRYQLGQIRWTFVSPFLIRYVHTPILVCPTHIMLSIQSRCSQAPSSYDTVSCSAPTSPRHLAEQQQQSTLGAMTGPHDSAGANLGCIVGCPTEKQFDERLRLCLALLVFNLLVIFLGDGKVTKTCVVALAMHFAGLVVPNSAHPSLLRVRLPCF